MIEIEETPTRSRLSTSSIITIQLIIFQIHPVVIMQLTLLPNISLTFSELIHLFHRVRQDYMNKHEYFKSQRMF